MTGPFLALSRSDLVSKPIFVDRQLFRKTFSLTTYRDRAHQFASKDEAFAAIASLQMSFRFVVEDVVTQEVFA